MDAPAFARLKRNLAAATDEALVALANRGLVRRAAKDLEQSAELTVDVQNSAVLVRGEGWTVIMPPEGPAAATDDTPASGVTRQVLTATMFLRDRWLQPEPDTAEGEAPESAFESEAEPLVAVMHAAAQCLIDAPPAELFKWAGKTPVLEAAACLVTAGAVEISYAPQLKIVFTEADVSVVLISDKPARTLRKLLEQFKTTANKSEHSRWIMLAVLTLKQAAGKGIVIASDDAPNITQAVREDRQLVSQRTLRLLRSIAASGIAHPSTRIVERLRTSSVSAEAAKFPRLARLLNSIATDAELQIARDAGADPDRMRQRIVVAYALAEATSREQNAERIDLFGRSRTAYTPVPELDLCGLGAYGWRTPSGFEGLTSLFWDIRGQRFLTATVSRVDGQDRTFSIPQAYTCGVGWSGGGPIELMCRSHLKLVDAKTNAEGRLSLSESCTATLAARTAWGAIDFGDLMVKDWSQLSRLAQASQPLGLRIPDARAALAVIQPANWGQRWYDELDQSFVWELHDEQGQAFEVRVPWSDITEASILFLESLDVECDQVAAIFGRLEVRGALLSLYPYSILSRGTIQGDLILCPQFDQARIRSRNEALLRRLREKYKRQPIVETRIGSDDADDDLDSDHDLTYLPGALRALLLDLDNLLASALESGAAACNNPAVTELLTRSRDQLRSLGLKPLADALQAMLHESERGLPNILPVAYRLQLLRQSLSMLRL